MSILGRLALLFVVVPLVELAFLIQVGRWVGIWPTVALVFLTGILGATLARAEGLRTLWAFRREMASGKIPGQPLLDGLCILVGGALLLTPGFVTDLAGFSLLLPPTRRLLQRGMKRRLRKMVQEGSVQVMTSSGLFGDGFGGGFGGSGQGPGEGGPGGRGGPAGGASGSDVPGSGGFRSGESPPGGGSSRDFHRGGWGPLQGRERSRPEDEEEDPGGAKRKDLDPEKEISQ